MLLILRNDLQVSDGGDLCQSLVLFATALSMVFISLGRVLMPKECQQQLWFYCLGSWFFAVFLGGLGYACFDRWKTFHSQSPSAATLVAVGGFGVAIGFRVVLGWLVRGMLKPVSAVTEPSELAGLTDDGRWRVCLHEAGHAICYGLTEGIPDDASIGIDTDAFSMVAGVVTLPQPRDLTSITRSLLEWQLLMLMAGGAAERHFLGEESICGSGDQEAFSRTAAQYLLAGYGEIFTMEPKDATELEANRNAILRLRDHYRAVARDFIAKNTETCLYLARLVKEREWIGGDDLAALKLQVTYPEGSWPLRWPADIRMICPPLS